MHGRRCGGLDAGAVYIVLDALPGTVDLSDASAKAFGSGAGDWVGSTPAGAGDLDGDGTADLVVGVPYDDSSRMRARCGSSLAVGSEPGLGAGGPEHADIRERSSTTFCMSIRRRSANPIHVSMHTMQSTKPTMIPCRGGDRVVLRRPGFVLGQPAAIEGVDGCCTMPGIGSTP